MPGHNAASKHKTIACGEATLTEIVGVGRVDVANEFKEGGGLRDHSVNVGNRGGRRNVGELRTRGRAPVMDAPVHGSTKVEGKGLEGVKMDAARSSRKLGKRSHGIANVGATNNVGVEDLAEKSSVGETSLDSRAACSGVCSAGPAV